MKGPNRFLQWMGVIGVGLIALGSLGCRQFIRELRARQLIREANELYRKEEYNLACPKYEEALRLRPYDLPLKKTLAYCYMGWFKPLDPSPENIALVDKAAALFKDILLETPEDRDVEDSLIGLYMNANRYDEVIQILEDRLKRNPQDVDTIKQIANLYVKMNRYETAFEWYQRWAQVDPENVEPWYVIGSLAWQKVYCEPRRCADPTLTNEERGHFIEQGLEALQRAVEVNPKHTFSYVYLNLLYREKAKWIDRTNPAKREEDLRKAEEYYTKAMQLLEEEKKKKGKEVKALPAPVPSPGTSTESESEGVKHAKGEPG